jgi:hypothetical protein
VIVPECLEERRLAGTRLPGEEQQVPVPTRRGVAESLGHAVEQRPALE